MLFLPFWKLIWIALEGWLSFQAIQQLLCYSCGRILQVFRPGKCCKPNCGRLASCRSSSPLSESRSVTMRDGQQQQRRKGSKQRQSTKATLGFNACKLLHIHYKRLLSWVEAYRPSTNPHIQPPHMLTKVVLSTPFPQCWKIG